MTAVTLHLTIPPMKEKDLQRLVLDWLSAHRIWHIRLNTGAMSGSHKGKKWFVKFGKPGMADILVHMWKPCSRVCPGSGVFSCGRDYYWKEPLTIWIELKAKRGVQSPAQKEFQQEVEAHGMKYILARSLEDVQQAIQGTATE